MNEFFARRPALRFTLLFIVGILIAENVRLASIPILFIELLLLGAVISISFTKSFTSYSSLLLVCAVVGLGALIHTRTREEIQGRWLIPSRSVDTVRIEGTIESSPAEQGQWISCVCAVSGITRERTKNSEGRTILLLMRTTKGRTASFEVGDWIEADGVIQNIPRPRNPGEFDYGRYLELNGVQGVIKIEEGAFVAISSDHEQVNIVRWVSGMRRNLFQVIDGLHISRHASFLKGVILGYRSDIAIDIKQSFVDTGTIHILAVSGSNVAVVALVFMAVFRLLRVPTTWIPLPTIVGLIWYMFITGLSASVIRATIMATMLLAGTMIGRKSEIYNTLSGAAMVLLLWNTNNLFDVGFQLSFAAVLSIVYFYPILLGLIKRIPERIEEFKSLDAVLKLFAVSLAAQLGTLPFTAYYFGRVSVVSLLANLVVVPLSGFNVLIGFAEMAFAILSPWIAQSFAALNGLFVWFLLGFVKVAAAVPFAYVETASVPILYAAVFYSLLFFFTTWERPGIAGKFLILSLLAMNGAIFQDAWTNTRTRFRATMIDVGQGDAILLQFPNGKSALVDAGPASFHYDAGERIVGPFLKREGIKQLDALFLSHGHADHIGGVPYLLEHFSVRTLIESERTSNSVLNKQIHSFAERKGISLQTIGVGDTVSLDGSVRIFVLHPQLPVDSASNLNNVSLVLKIVFGTTSILFCGDAEEEAEERMVLRYGSFLDSDIIKVGHHGSNTSSSERFVDTVTPTVALVSVAARNKFKHPSSEVLRRYKEKNAKVHLTMNEGAVILESDGQHWSQVNWRANE